MNQLRIISIRENPKFKDKAINFFQTNWPSVMPEIYENNITNCINAKLDLPQWYLLLHKSEIIGGAGLINNDFISRGDLYPWLCALFIKKNFRGNNLAKILIDRIKIETKELNYNNLYLCTSLNNFYEKHGFSYVGDGFHPWGDSSKIYEIGL